MMGQKTNKRTHTAPLFEVKKKHSWRGRLISAIEIGLILVVLVGTVVWVLWQSHFSFGNFVKQISEKLRPEIVVQKNTRDKTAKEDLRNLIESQKVFEIEYFNDTTNGFEVKGKNNAIVVFSTAKDFAEQVTTLQTLLAKAKIDNKVIKRIDFRFEKIVVQY